MRPETYELNKSLVLSALSNIEAWERWADAVPTGAAKALNLSLIRLVKGLVKAWRLFLQEQNASAASSMPISRPSSAAFDRRA